VIIEQFAPRKIISTSYYTKKRVEYTVLFGAKSDLKVEISTGEIETKFSDGELLDLKKTSDSKIVIFVDPVDLKHTEKALSIFKRIHFSDSSCGKLQLIGHNLSKE